MPAHSASSIEPPAKPASTQLIVALDSPSAAAALTCVEQLAGLVVWYKVGLELYLGAGDAIVRELKQRGYSVFLDLKLHDIPNTVAGAVRSLARLEPDLLTVHAMSGAAVMRAAAEAAHSLPRPPRLLAVTVLTSIDAASLAETGISGTAQEQVLRLAKLAQSSGIDGMVCSPQEVAMLRRTLPDALLVTPGIRPALAEPGDQQRIATPQAALAAGAGMLVVGRPITAAPDPRAAATAILEEMTHQDALPVAATK